MQAVLSASGKASNVGAAGGGGSGAVAARSTEAAASIGFRDSSIQMLRDSYFRLCEAYMNGVLTDADYEHMVTNADTYLAVASALQIIGSNPVAPTVAISAGGGTTTANFATGSSAGATDDTDAASADGSTSSTSNPKTPAPAAAKQADPEAQKVADGAIKARLTEEVVRSYLGYRARLAKDVDADLRRDRLDQKAGPRVYLAPPPPPLEIYVPR
jgi:hypothetical protein